LCLSSRWTSFWSLLNQRGLQNCVYTQIQLVQNVLTWK
jgi:hypothetical protein